MKKVLAILILIFGSLSLGGFYFLDTHETIINEIKNQQISQLLHFAFRPYLIFSYSFYEPIIELYELITDYKDYLHPSMKYMIISLLSAYVWIFIFHLLIVFLIIKTCFHYFKKN